MVALLAFRIALSIDCMPLKAPTTITEPGCYEVTNTIEASEDTYGIRIMAGNVKIIGNGYCINGSQSDSTETYGIYASSVSNLSIDGVCVTGFRFGIIVRRDGDYIVRNVRIHNNVVRGSSYNGIRVYGNNVDVSDNAVSEIGGDATIPHSFAHLIYVSGDFVKIARNRLIDPRPVGNGEGVCLALYEGKNSEVTANYCKSNARPRFGRIFGMWIDTQGNSEKQISVVGNAVINADYAYGPYGIYGRNSLENIACSVSYDGHWEGGIRAITTGDDPDVEDGSWECRDNIAALKTRFYEGRQAEIAFSIAQAYYRVENAMSIEIQNIRDTWVVVSEKLGHTLAALRITRARELGALDPAFEECASRLLAHFDRDFNISQECEF